MSFSAAFILDAENVSYNVIVEEMRAASIAFS